VPDETKFQGQIGAGCCGPLLWLFASILCTIHLVVRYEFSWSRGSGIGVIVFIVGLALGLIIVQILDRIDPKSIEACAESGWCGAVVGTLLWLFFAIVTATSLASSFATSKSRGAAIGLLIFASGLVLWLVGAGILFLVNGKKDGAESRTRHR
jgi:hypothetical protein